MKHQEQIESRVSLQALLAVTLALAVVWLVGCRTAVYQQGDRAAGSAQAAAVGVQSQSQSLGATMTTLTNLVYNPAADLKPQFLAFSSALDRLVAATERGGVTGSHLVRSNAAYMAAWNKQLGTITNADVRSRSEARKTEVANQFNAANANYAQAQSALWSLVDYLQDIRKALSADLTPGGVGAVKSIVSNARTNASKVQADLAQSGAQLGALSTSMSSARGPGGK